MITLRSISGLSSISADSVEVAGLNGNTPITIGNGEVAADKFTSYTTNSDVLLDPNGSGDVAVTSDVILASGKAVAADLITASTANGNLSIYGNGSGYVSLDSDTHVAASKTLFVDTIISKTTNADLSISANGTGVVSSDSNLIVAASKYIGADIFTSSTPLADVTVSPSGGGQVVITSNMKVNSILARTTNSSLTLAGNGTGGIIANSALTLNSTLVGDSMTAKTTNGNLTLAGNGTGVISMSTGLIVDSIAARTTNGDLSLAGNGTGFVRIARQPCGFFERITSAQTVNNVAITTVLFNTTIYAKFTSISSGVVTVQKAGIWRVEAQCIWGLSASAGRVLSTIVVNGSNVLRNEISYSKTSGDPVQNISGHLILAANDQVRVDVFQDSGLAGSISYGAPCTCLSIVYVCD